MNAISWDPSINKAGYCVWTDGHIRDCGVVKTRGQLPGEKLKSLYDRVIELSMKWRPQQVAVEAFEHHHSKDKAMGHVSSRIDMAKCACAQGVIFAASLAATPRVMLVSKRQISKPQTEILARSYGLLTKDKDALDAFQIGVCAGFDASERQWRKLSK